MVYADAKSVDAGTIPVIDITPLRDGSDPQSVAKKLHDANTGLGFIYIKGHGIPQYVIEKAREAAYKFFRASPDEKEIVKISTKHRGWIGTGGAKMEDDLKPDLKESFLWGYEDEKGDTPEDHELRGGFMHRVTEKIEWAALLFFAGLFILVGAVGNVGYLSMLANWIFVNFGADQVMLAVAVVWVSAIASAIVDNIPFTAAMIPVIISISEANPEVDPAPLLWALAMGAGFGGNATPIGSSANVMTVAISERGPRPITTAEWLKVGFPVMIITCVAATVFIILFHGILYSSY